VRAGGALESEVSSRRGRLVLPDACPPHIDGSTTGHAMESTSAAISFPNDVRLLVVKPVQLG
jgi:hypothetical protein